MTVAPSYFIEAFKAKKHNRENFDCGSPPLNTYLKKQVSQDIRKSLTAAYVICESESTTILGYYTLSTLSIPLEEIDEKRKKKLPQYELLPTILLGRLAVDKEQQGKKIGEKLLVDALERSLKLSEQIAAFAVIVGAKDANAVNFYKNYGSIQYASVPEKLYLPMQTINSIF